LKSHERLLRHIHEVEVAGESKKTRIETLVVGILKDGQLFHPVAGESKKNKD